MDFILLPASSAHRHAHLIPCEYTPSRFLPTPGARDLQEILGRPPLGEGGGEIAGPPGRSPRHRPNVGAIEIELVHGSKGGREQRIQACTTTCY